MDDIADIGIEDDIDEIEMSLITGEDDEAEIESEEFIEDETGDVGPQPIIVEAMKGGEPAFTTLITHSWMIQLLNEISGWAEWKFQQDKEEIRQILLIKIWIKICSLKNPLRFRPWCYSIARRHCLNQVRHMRVVNSYRQVFKRQNEESTRQHGQPLVQSSAASEQERELLKKEQKSILEKKIRMATSSFPPEIVELWLNGKSPSEIAKAVNRPVKTIYRILKEMEKAIIKDTNEPQGDDNNV